MRHKLYFIVEKGQDAIRKGGFIEKNNLLKIKKEN